MADLTRCVVRDHEALLLYAILSVAAIPAAYAIYEMNHSLLRMFLSARDLRRQQELVLEVFEKQNDAAIGIRPEVLTRKNGADGGVLYTNHAFKRIFGHDHERALDAEAIRVYQNDDGSEAKSFSLKSLIQQSSEFIQNNIFRITTQQNSKLSCLISKRHNK